jgi:hydroxypyruvate reductase/glycerate 2-kinase
MAAALEEHLGPLLTKTTGLLNVPESQVQSLERIELVAARPDRVNFPTREGVAGVERMLALLSSAGPKDIALCLISGGGSALLPAPAPGITLADKLHLTQLLHASGASITEMNTLRKHISRVKGGQLAQAFTGQKLISMIISDVVGDPLDVIASGPTVPDPTTFDECITILERYELLERIPASVREHLEAGVRGDIPETLKLLPEQITNCLIGSNAHALSAARDEAQARGYTVLNLGSELEGEARQVARTMARIGPQLACNNGFRPPVCLLFGGETTVTLGKQPGKGGRNQEFALAAALALRERGVGSFAILSGGTDGEDGPTDAAGALLTARDLRHVEIEELVRALDRHDTYPVLDQLGALLRTGLTGTNVMDLQVLLLGKSPVSAP